MKNFFARIKMHTVCIIQLILSVLVSILLLVIGISGLVKKNLSVMNMSASNVMVGEWVFVSLGALLLIFSVWSFMEGEHYDFY